MPILSIVEGCRSRKIGKFKNRNKELFCTMLYNTRQEAYYLYIILCNDGSFYTGLTDDLIRRFEEHVNGVYETCYTFKRRPLVLKYYETIPFLKDATEREVQIKGWSRSKKVALI